MHSESSAAAKYKPISPTESPVNIPNPLQLPDLKDSESWFEVNATFRQVLSLDLLLIKDPDKLHNMLVSTIYSVLHGKFEDRAFHHHHKHRRHDCQLKRFRNLKNDA